MLPCREGKLCTSPMITLLGRSTMPSLIFLQASQRIFRSLGDAKTARTAQVRSVILLNTLVIKVRSQRCNGAVVCNGASPDDHAC
jgi:hypothetical protein